ncbi:hypothetical protein DL96DRAFT_1720798 [Flagelloscypha sp. PMI_526]|nr:hypothetical protein DL96DRAFT_1720798 [Flagelloscypha sp. PMI_526]
MAGPVLLNMSSSERYPQEEQTELNTVKSSFDDSDGAKCRHYLGYGRGIPKGNMPVCQRKIVVPAVLENFVADVKIDGKGVELALWDTMGQDCELGDRLLDMLTLDSTDYGDQLLREIDRLAEERRSYASKFNDTLPIFRLAPETLCAIFMFYKQDTVDGRFKLPTMYLISWSSLPKGWSRPWCYVPWVAVSYVCRRFRSLTLDFPSFWNTLCAHSIPWTRELILRSKQAPLHVLHLSALPPAPPTAGKDREVALFCLRLALAHSSRIETLELLNFDLSSLKGREEWFTEVLNPKNFPNLRNIAIILSGSPNRRIFPNPGNPYSSSVPIPEGSDASIRLAKSLAQQSHSPLRNLELSGCGRSIWSQTSSSSSLASLSRLVIEACPDATLSTILSALKSLPQLQHLIIRDCKHIDSFQLDDVALTSSLMGITLPSLRSFTLSGVLGIGGRLLESLILPSDVKLRLELGISPPPHGVGVGTVGEPPFLERFERLLQVLDTYLNCDSDSYVVEKSDLYVQDDSDHEAHPLNSGYQAVSKSQKTSMLFTNGSGALCFALSDTYDYDPPFMPFGSAYRFVPAISSYRSPAPDPWFQFIADLSRHRESAAQISEALLSRIKSGSLLGNVEHVILREFQPGLADVCSWPTARWLQTVVHLPRLKKLDADLNLPSMVVLFGLLDVHQKGQSFALTHGAELGSIPPSAVQLQSLNLHRVDPRLLTNVPAPAVANSPAPPLHGLPGVNTIINPALNPFGGHMPAPISPFSILPYPPPSRPTQSPNNHIPLVVSPVETILHSGGHPNTASHSLMNSAIPAQSQSWPWHSNLTGPVSPPKVLQPSILFGKEVPSVESLREFLIEMRSIVGVFQGRKDAGLPLEKLTIRSSEMSEETSEKLKEIVSEVDWDREKNYDWKNFWDNAFGNIDGNLNASD